MLAGAVDVFLTEADNIDPHPRTSLVTWGTNYSMPISPYTIYQESTVDVSLPQRLSHNWTQNRQAITGGISSLGNLPMMGGTNMSAGLDTAVAELTKPSASTMSHKIVILLTDGRWNSGRDPALAAQDAADAGIVVHTITMLSDDAATMTEIANITGGKYYDARNEAELRAAFFEIARSLPIVLTE